MKQDKITMVVIGDEGVGKSALILKLCLDRFPECHDPTADDTIRKPAMIDGQPCVINIIDTGGREKYDTMAERWIGYGQAFVLAFDISSKESLKHVQLYYDQIKRIKKGRPANDPNPKGIESIVPGAFPMILVGNKSDLENQREVSAKQGMELASAMGCEYFETSAKADFNVAAPFERAVRLYRQRERHKFRGLFWTTEEGTEGFPKYRRQYFPFKKHFHKLRCATQ